TNGLEDFSGNSNNGTASNVNGSGMTFTTGKVGSAVQFDGADDNSRLPNNIGLGQSELTVSVWVKHNSFGTSGSSRPYVSDWNIWSSGYQKGFILRTYDISDKPGFNICDGINYFSVGSSESINISVWYNIVGVFKANSIYKIYINGLQKGSSNAPSQYIKESTSPIYIGYSGINPGKFDGLIDDLRIYNRALSAPEIQAIYNAGK
ncbi:MAG: LamG domain-containing protein, partial [Candidatus Colwellbacteria bacterium]|nr:LamG domain-containing protein [Candidatus Colwellbacteria bacterium]